MRRPALSFLSGQQPVMGGTARAGTLAPPFARAETFLGDKDGVDDVDYTVACSDVGLNDICSAGFYLTLIHLDGEFLAAHCLGIACRDICCHDLARNDVVGKHGDQFLFVFRFEQVVDRSLWELGKSFVCRCEDREGSRDFLNPPRIQSELANVASVEYWNMGLFDA